MRRAVGGERVELVVITLTGFLEGIVLISGYVGFHNLDGIILSRRRSVDHSGSSKVYRTALTGR